MLLGLSAVFFGYANFVLVGYFKDIEADRQTGYNTLPVVFGRRTSSVVSNVFGLLAIISAILVFTYSLSPEELLHNKIFALLILAAGIIGMILCQIFVHFIKSDDESSKAINLSVHAYILLLAALVVLNKIEWLIPMIIFYILFNLTIAFRPSKNQI